MLYFFWAFFILQHLHILTHIHAREQILKEKILKETKECYISMRLIYTAAEMENHSLKEREEHQTYWSDTGSSITVGEQKAGALLTEKSLARGTEIALQ